MSKIISNYTYNTANQLLLIIVPIFTAPYLARVLGAEKLGIFGYVNSISTIVVTFSLLGTYTYGCREIAYHKNDKHKMSSIFWQLMILRIIILIFVTIIYIYLSIQSKYMEFFLINYFFILAYFLDVSWVFVGMENMKPAIVKNVISKLVTLVGIYLMIKSSADLWIYVLISSFSLLIANISVYSLLKNIILTKRIISYFEIKKITSIFKGSFFLFLPQVSAMLFLQIDKIMIERMTGYTEQVGMYVQAEKIIQLPLALLVGFSIVIMPRIANEYSKSNFNSIKQYLNNTIESTLMLSIPLSIGIACISSKFIPWFLGSEFEPTQKVLILLSPLVLFNSLIGISSKVYFTATNQTSLMLKSNVIALILNVVMNYFLIPKHGFIGAAIASLISALLLMVIQFFYLSKQLDVSGFLNVGLKYLFYSIVMAIFVVSTGFWFEPSFILTFLQMLLGFVVYFVCLAVNKDKCFFEVKDKLLIYLRKSTK